MNTKFRRLPARFAVETRFEVTPLPAVPFRGTIETDLERLKARLLTNLLNEADEPKLIVPLRWAANEAAVEAWLTPFPLLFFPALLEEKAEIALRQAERQELIRLRSVDLFAEAV